MSFLSPGVYSKDMGTLLGIALVILAAYSARKLFSASSQPVKLGPDETAIAEVLVKTDDLRHHTVRITYPHNDEGRLVVTNLRLLYMSYDQKRTTLAVPLGAISQVEVGKKKKLLSLIPTLTVAYQEDAGPNRTTWFVPPEMVEYGNPLLFMGDKRQANPHTADQFAELLNRERAKHPAGAEQTAQVGGAPAAISYRCPKCQTPVEADAKRCPGCGGLFQAGVAAGMTE